MIVQYSIESDIPGRSSKGFKSLGHCFRVKLSESEMQKSVTGAAAVQTSFNIRFGHSRIQMRDSTELLGLSAKVFNCIVSEVLISLITGPKDVIVKLQRAKWG